MTKKYIIRETMPCYVSWYYEIEADSKDDAYDIFCNGEHCCSSIYTEIGDGIGWAGDNATEVVDELPISAQRARRAND